MPAGRLKITEEVQREIAIRAIIGSRSDLHITPGMWAHLDSVGKRGRYNMLARWWRKLVG